MFLNFPWETSPKKPTTTKISNGNAVKTHNLPYVIAQKHRRQPGGTSCLPLCWHSWRRAVAYCICSALKCTASQRQQKSKYEAVPTKQINFLTSVKLKKKTTVNPSILTQGLSVSDHSILLPCSFAITFFGTLLAVYSTEHYLWKKKILSP